MDEEDYDDLEDFDLTEEEEDLIAEEVTAEMLRTGELLGSCAECGTYLAPEESLSRCPNCGTEVWPDRLVVRMTDQLPQC